MSLYLTILNKSLSHPTMAKVNLLKICTKNAKIMNNEKTPEKNCEKRVFSNKNLMKNVKKKPEFTREIMKAA